jgi:ribosomal protein S12 methylthiotransferase accessory factor
MMGCGKGHLDVARVGALYEALEHYLTGPEDFHPECLVLRSAHRVAAAPELNKDAATAILAEGPDEPLPCRRYQSLPDEQEIVAPLILSAPWYAEEDNHELRRRLGDTYDYRTVARYSLNNGCAIGANRLEAAVHGINEVIERDALSTFLIRAFFTSHTHLAIFDRASLPTDLFKMLEYVESVIGAQISLFDMTTDLGVPSALAYAPPGPNGIVRRGSGTSLSAHHAVYRAVGELLQGVLGIATVPDYQPPSLNTMSDHPKLHRCAAMELEEHVRRAHTVALVDEPVPAEPEGHLAKLVGLLAARGYRPYLSHYRTLSTGITAVHVLIPGLERFMAVLLGNLVVPGRRGMAMLRSDSPRTGGRR